MSSVTTIPAELYFHSEAALGEGPVWDRGTLWWVDITGQTIFAKRDRVAVAERFEVGLQVGALALWHDDQMVLATERGFHAFDPGRGKLEAWTDPEAGVSGNRFNDGKCDPQGRFVAGTMNRSGEAKAALYVLESDRSVREIYRPVTCSNGLAWPEDGGTLFYIDTPTRVVRAFSYNLTSGALSDERVVIEIPKSHGAPDGMTIDRAGNLWIALWDGWGVECWSPASGQQLARVEVPVARVTSCVFGGADYDTLFITTAREGLDAAALGRQSLAGSVFQVRPGVAGFPAMRYQGAAK